MRESKDTKSEMIARLAAELRKQSYFDVLTDIEVTERFNKKVDPDFVRCYYPGVISPNMLTCYVKKNYVWIVGHAEDFQYFSSDLVSEQEKYRSNLYKFKVEENYEGGLNKTAKVVFEMFDFIKKKSF